MKLLKKFWDFSNWLTRKMFLKNSIWEVSREDFYWKNQQVQILRNNWSRSWGQSAPQNSVKNVKRWWKTYKSLRCWCQSTRDSTPTSKTSLNTTSTSSPKDHGLWQPNKTQTYNYLPNSCHCTKLTTSFTSWNIRVNVWHLQSIWPPVYFTQISHPGNRNNSRCQGTKLWSCSVLTLKTERLTKSCNRKLD